MACCGEDAEKSLQNKNELLFYSETEGMGQGSLNGSFQVTFARLEILPVADYVHGRVGG